MSRARDRSPAWRRGLGRGLARALLALALLTALLAGQRLYAAWAAHDANRQLAAGVARPGAPAMVVFGQAVALDRAGSAEAALAAYAQAESLGDARLRHAVRVNVANLYLRQGIAAARDEGQAQRALVLVQLAKSTYRRALRDQPDDWNARYNLELAARLVPDYEVRNWRRSGSESEVEDAQRDRAGWSEFVGPPRGMH